MGLFPEQKLKLFPPSYFVLGVGFKDSIKPVAGVVDACAFIDTGAVEDKF